MADAPKLNSKVIYVFICTSTAIIYYILVYHSDILRFIPFIGPVLAIVIPVLKWFFVGLFVLWFNKFISSKIKQLYGLEINNGNLSVTRTIDEPGVYNVFSDMVTGIGNSFIYIVTLQFLYPKPSE